MTYQTHFLVFPDQATAMSALAAANLVRSEGDDTYYDYGIDIVGLNPQELDQAAGCYDADGNPIFKQHAGYHVNFITDKPLHEALQQYVVNPTTPMRVFAGA